MPDLGEWAGDRLPVHDVSHVEAQAYAAWAGATLPTEAQWERAAKGGHDEWPYAWGLVDDATKRNSAGTEDGYPGLAPIGSFDANPFGLHEMGGNVWEWCADGYDERAYDRGDAVDPTGPASSEKRVARGGGCFGETADVACRLRVTFRLALAPQVRNSSLGFRCARTLP
jgi:formylglycine-generating enzyme required for sulfatase activity